LLRSRIIIFSRKNRSGSKSQFWATSLCHVVSSVSALVALEPGTSLLAGETIYDAVTVTGGALRPGDEVAPAVFTPGDTLFGLAEVKSQLQKGKAEKTVSGEDTPALWGTVQQCRVTEPGHIGIEGAQFIEPLPLTGTLCAVEGQLKDVPKIGLRPNWLLQDTKDLLSGLQKKRRAAVVLRLQALV